MQVRINDKLKDINKGIIQINDELVVNAFFETLDGWLRFSVTALEDSDFNKLADTSYVIDLESADDFFNYYLDERFESIFEGLLKIDFKKIKDESIKAIISLDGINSFYFEGILDIKKEDF